MNTNLLNGESIIKEGKANLQRGIETVGGHLYLTAQRLIFESHKFNVQQGTTIIDLGNINEVTKCWTKFLNLIPLYPNSIKVETRDNKQYKFVCFGRKDWISATEGSKKN